MTLKQFTLKQFLETVDVTEAGRDEYGDLRWHVACSAEANANDMGLAVGSPEWEAAAVATAELAYDDWRTWFPQLRK